MMPLMAVGFFEMFFDNDTRQREDINDLREHNTSLAVELSSNIGEVRAYAVTLQKQVNDLSLAVAVMMRMLEESGQLDTKILRYRLEAEHEAIEAARLAQIRGRYAVEPAPVEAPPPATPTLCGTCGKTVPAHQTVITADGVVCDQCGTK